MQPHSHNVVCIDSPKDMPIEDLFLLQGWIATQSKIDFIWLNDLGNIIELQQQERADAFQAMSPTHTHVIGFQQYVPKSVLRYGGAVIYYRTQAGDNKYHLFSERYVDFGIDKATKLARVVPYLICPVCQGKLQAQATKLHCTSCDKDYARTENHIDFLTPDLRQRYQVIDGEHISSHSYDEIALSLIRECCGGLVLDCGAGSRQVDFSNVINFEIADYPSTDILGVAEQLPFADETFEGVLSLAVLEHVSDPFRCAAEISRVLKKGGKLYCVVPFLQPVHAYPNHFYNMTAQGLANLFNKSMYIRESFVPLSGVPMWMLSAVLNSWAMALEGSTREQFLDMRVAELINDPITYLNQDVVTKLPGSTNFELACTTAIIAEKF
jgi:SAM-dependent methyltransferase